MKQNTKFAEILFNEKGGVNGSSFQLPAESRPSHFANTGQGFQLKKLLLFLVTNPVGAGSVSTVLILQANYGF